jgi:hypothetical protein
VTTATARRATRARAPAPQKSATPRERTRQNTRGTSETKGTAVQTRKRVRASADVADRARPTRPVEHAVLAAEQAVRKSSLYLRIPVLGAVNLPASEQVAFIGGLAVLTVIGVLEWPVAVLLGIGHGVATHAHRTMVRALGEALEAG